MSAPIIHKGELLVELRLSVELANSQKTWAEFVGISQQYLSDVLNGHREPGDKICKALGYQKVVLFEKIDPMASSGSEGGR